ncbi:hypothetical protein ACNKHT_15460 [Shigella flexneri]
MRAPEQYLWIDRRFKTRPVENRRCTFNKLLSAPSPPQMAIITSWFLWLFLKVFSFAEYRIITVRN